MKRFEIKKLSEKYEIIDNEQIYKNTTLGFEWDFDSEFEQPFCDLLNKTNEKLKDDILKKEKLAFIIVFWEITVSDVIEFKNTKFIDSVVNLKSWDEIEKSEFHDRLIDHDLIEHDIEDCIAIEIASGWNKYKNEFENGNIHIDFTFLYSPSYGDFEDYEMKFSFRGNASSKDEQQYLLDKFGESFVNTLKELSENEKNIVINFINNGE